MSPVFRHGRLRLYLLKLLDEAPRHGYEVIRLLQDRFMGIYAPSPGTIYPRLARLEEEGLVTHDEADGRKVYRITEKGREELHARLDDLTELEEEITASVRDIAREVTEDVRETVRTLREELSWATREFHAKAHQSPGSTRTAARQAGTGEARARPEAAWAQEAAAGEQAARPREAAGEQASRPREATDRAPDDAAPAGTRAREDEAQAGDRAHEDAPAGTRAREDEAQAGDRARRDAPRAGDEWARVAAEPPAAEDLPRDREQAGSGATGDRARSTGDRARAMGDRTGASGGRGRDRHEEPHGTSGRRGEREWGEWAGWTGWGGWPGAAGQHGWADPDAYRDLERLAKQFSRELRSAAWHAQAVSEEALRDLRGILDETIDRIKDEVFKGNAPGQPGDPDDGPPPAP
jgi:DNA-binding PadR family transcriptional regulator